MFYIYYSTMEAMNIIKDDLPESKKKLLQEYIAYIKKIFGTNNNLYTEALQTQRQNEVSEDFLNEHITKYIKYYDRSESLSWVLWRDWDDKEKTNIYMSNSANIWLRDFQEDRHVMTDFRIILWKAPETIQKAQNILKSFDIYLQEGSPLHDYLWSKVEGWHKYVIIKLAIFYYYAFNPYFNTIEGQDKKDYEEWMKIQLEKAYKNFSMPPKIRQLFETTLYSRTILDKQDDVTTADFPNDILIGNLLARMAEESSKEPSNKKVISNYEVQLHKLIGVL